MKSTVLPDKKARDIAIRWDELRPTISKATQIALVSIYLKYIMGANKKLTEALFASDDPIWMLEVEETLSSLPYANFSDFWAEVTELLPEFVNGKEIKFMREEFDLLLVHFFLKSLLVQGKEAANVFDKLSEF